jgi:pyrroloquinoline quinone biosynthesis protein B
VINVAVLGSAAGGGFPQWNCGSPNCAGVREGTVKAVRRTQECLALTGDGGRWILINASPDIRQQIEAFPALRPKSLRDSPIAAVILTNGDLDHCLGLFSLRERHPIIVYATKQVWHGLMSQNVFCRTLQRFPGQLQWRDLPTGSTQRLDPDGGALWITAFSCPGKVPLHLEGLQAHHPEDNIGVRSFNGTTQTLVYVPSARDVTPELYVQVQSAQCLYFDGTFWSQDELPGLGIADKTAADMGHLPIGGDGGSLALLTGLNVPRRIYIHINNTNPVLRADSPERGLAESAGWEVAHDGLELTL